MMQDAAPFPTGLADGFLKKEENLERNKLYLGERHLDVRGPVTDGAFLVSQLVGSVRSTDQENGFGKARPFPGDRLYAVVAFRRGESGLDRDTSVDLTQKVKEGMLVWDVPEGIWRIFVIFETKNDGGRRYYINLLDPDSVAMNIQAIYEPHYEHLKEEVGRTWLGFFYDEAEIGNLWRYCTPVLPGATRNVEGESMALPWSRQMEQVWRDQMGEDYRLVLPLLWNQDEEQTGYPGTAGELGAGEYHRIRCLFMDLVSRLVRETFNGVMQKWCREHGLWYIGHNLEDENTHCSLATGPAHFFRMQAHQDAAGIDLIGGQLMPGKDFPQAWYGNTDGDGEFYHYGIAKLASSAAHIDPGKKGRSFCEVFAVYGAIAGSRLRKYVYDHLMVNGINEMIPAPPFIPGAEEACSLRENLYVNRMCHLLHRTKPVIKVAVLYHAEAEWYQGKFQRFQTPGGELARHQISYDVIPADVLEEIVSAGDPGSDSEQAVNASFRSGGLVVNGNRYEALVIPACDAVSDAAVDFLALAETAGFPVFYCDRAPRVAAQTGERIRNRYGQVVPLHRLADELSGVVRRDFALRTYCPDFRYAHFTGKDGEFYLILNEGKGGWFEIDLYDGLPDSGRVYFVDVMRQTIRETEAVRENGRSSVRLFLDEWQSGVLYVRKREAEEKAEDAGAFGLPVRKEPAYERKEELKALWNITLQDGTIFCSEKPVNINGSGLAPRYVGKVVYEAEADWPTVPHLLYLGAVYEICTLYLNGKYVGTVQNTPYCFDIEDYAEKGKNSIRIEAQTGTARDTDSPDSAAFGRSMSADVYNVLEPGGMLGPVVACYHS